MTSNDYKQFYSHGNASAEALPKPPEEIRAAAGTVFISYSTKNPLDAGLVCGALEKAGIRCWIAPRDLLAGTNFADNIEIALGNAEMMVLILSRQSAKSPWVESEINTAFSARKPILIFRIDDVELAGSLKLMLSLSPAIQKSGNSKNDRAAIAENARKILAGEALDIQPLPRAGTQKTAVEESDYEEDFDVPEEENFGVPAAENFEKPVEKSSWLSKIFVVLVVIALGVIAAILMILAFPQTRKVEAERTTERTIENREEQIEVGGNAEKIDIPAESVPSKSAENLGNGDDSLADEKISEKVDLKTGDKSVAVPAAEDDVPAIAVPAAENDVPAEIEPEIEEVVPADEPENSVPAEPESPEMADGSVPDNSIPRDKFLDVEHVKYVFDGGIEMEFSRIFSDKKWIANVGKTEVSQAQWKLLMDKNLSHEKDDHCPVTNVSWSDAMEFCRRLTKLLREKHGLAGTQKVTLLTSKQWEFFCRAGTQTRFCSGDQESDLDFYGWYRKNSGGRLHWCGQTEANKFGLFDMHGNAAEWCLDASPSNPSSRIIRGGNYNSTAKQCESSSTQSVPVKTRNKYLGFRVIIVEDAADRSSRK